MSLQAERFPRAQGTALLASLAKSLVKRVPPGSTVQFGLAWQADALAEIGRLRQDVLAHHSMPHILGELSSLGLEAEDESAWHYVLRLDGRIVACLRVLPGAPLSCRYFGAERFRREVGEPSRYVELGRLVVAADLALLWVPHALLAFAVLHLVLLHGRRLYVAYVSRTLARRLGYLSSRKQLPFTLDRGQSTEPCILCTDSLLPLLLRAIKLIARSVMLRATGRGRPTPPARPMRSRGR